VCKRQGHVVAKGVGEQRRHGDEDPTARVFDKRALVRASVACVLLQTLK